MRPDDEHKLRQTVKNGFAPSLEDFAAARRYMDDFLAGKIDPQEIVGLIAKGVARNEMRDRMNKPAGPYRLQANVVDDLVSVRPATAAEIEAVRR